MMKNQTSIPLLLCLLALPAISNAAVIFTSASDASATASIGTDLLQTSLTSTTWPTNNNINNGTTGAFNENSGTNPANVTTGSTASYTFFLDVGTNPLGYDIASINSFSGWGDNRAGQSYTIYLSTVATPLVFNQITPGGTGFDAVSVGASGQSLVTSVVDNTSAPLGTGVHSIRFDVGVNGAGNVWREIDVIGAATIPEPSAAILGGLGLLALLRRRRN